jgi:hypothetical protein
MPFDGIGLEGRGVALGKIDEVIDLLATEDRWCKQQLRSYDGRRCLLAAMLAADAAVMLKEPILLGIKQITGRDYLRIEIFNDHPLTTHGLVLRVLHQARENRVAGVLQPPHRPDSVSARRRWLGSPKPWERVRRLFA